MNDFRLTVIDKVVYSLLSVLVLAGVIISYYNVIWFEQNYVVEDGIIEWGTAIFLFLCFFLMIFRVITFSKIKPRLWLAGSFLIALLFLFGVEIYFYCFRHLITLQHACQIYKFIIKKKGYGI